MKDFKFTRRVFFSIPVHGRAYASVGFLSSMRSRLTIKQTQF